MKKLLSPGVVISISPARRGRGRQYDWWTKHAVGIDFADSGESGLDWYAIFAATLKDGHTYQYSSASYGQGVPAEAAVRAWIASYVNFPSANGYVGWYGEWFNSVGRAAFISKVLVS